MSNSPKYSRARLTAERERRLREQRRAKAEQERAHRDAEAERRRRERLALAQTEAREEARVVGKDIERFATSTDARFASSVSIAELRRELREVAEQADRADQETDVRAAMRKLRALGGTLRRTVAEAAATQLQMARQLAAEAASVARLERQLAAVDPAQAAKFDAEGAREVRAILGRAKERVAQNALDEARRTVTESQARLERHRADVADRLSLWTAERDQASADLSDAEDRVAALRVDPTVTSWQAAALPELVLRLQEAARLIGAEQFAAVRAAVADLLARVDQTLAVAQEQQLKEERRQYIVEGLVQAMRQLGFIVQGGTPALEHAGVPASATIIQAERLGGGAIAISVPQEGDIWYDVGGYPMRLETGGDGQPAHTCDEAENQIEQMHAVLNEAFGIQMGELMWDGKNPTRISRQADRLPDTAQGSRQKEGL